MNALIINNKLYKVKILQGKDRVVGAACSKCDLDRSTCHGPCLTFLSGGYTYFSELGIIKPESIEYEDD